MSRAIVHVFLLFVIATGSLKISLPVLRKQLLTRVATICIGICLQSPLAANAGMLTFPLPAPLKNNFVLVRAGESFADAEHEIQTNPVKKLRTDNALTALGQDQATAAAIELEGMDFSPTYIWVSNTERAYETAVVIARECQLGQNRIVPVFSDLDARALGIYEGKNPEEAWTFVHANDEKEGINYRPPPTSDGTPSDSIATVLMRTNQLVSTMESMYSGENIVIVSPDSDNLSILQAALDSDNPDLSLPKHSRFAFKNGEIRKLYTLVKPSELLVTGQTQAEADIMYRKMKAARIKGAKMLITPADQKGDWMDLWHLSVNAKYKYI
mmetsp:Transcript_35461/g.33641  ORF Transcript_35461/g.33641 Transcript_35461/m.33641 type:complete len:327 (+) Transcript_35461:196-1176(+)|eukprot:CAMPEP_0119051446 /NCGR_PEP_ID=MMETSP1177-20130426/73057_1 /TAXON_ID=2985 /ORGANISM="Ochromonas sp, Strain CCMP1899" /LENGTH=326 /DNA_ID=CAMNT_0007030649 /DNA_START=193 /DNA_END=1173 /DNA_ORIENTATION=-